MKKPIFEIHLEEWNHALHIDGRGHKSPVMPLLELLWKHGITPHVFVLRKWLWENGTPNNWTNVVIKSHGDYHYYDEKADRSPYFNQEGFLGFCGGFFFRVLPLWLLKKEIARTGIFYIHPHDLDEAHPRLTNPLLDWKRRVGLKTAKAKLERLLKEVRFA